jgi:hypothetical protein
VIHVERTGGMGAVDPLTVVARYGNFLFPLWSLIAVVSFAGSAIFATAVLLGRTALPRWMALGNPFLLTMVLVAAGAGSEGGRAFVVPAAPNLAHVVFFAAVAAMPPLERAPRRSPASRA